MRASPRLLACGLTLFATADLHAQADASPRTFDAGPEAAPGMLPLSSTDRYTPQRGYGWEGDLGRPFVRNDVATFRPLALQDGVAAPHLRFRSDVPDGDYRVTLWIEAGLEDSTTAVVTLNGGARPFPNQAFVPPAEPRTAIQKLYRVLHATVPVTDGHIRLEVDGGEADTVRVLQIALAPIPVRRTTQQRAWRQAVGDAGRFESTTPLAPLRDELDDGARQGDAFAAYWADDVGALADAEELLRMGGWGWATERQRAGIFDRFHQAVALLDGLLLQPDATTQPLYERALLARIRLLYWLWLEQGGEAEYRTSQRDVATLRVRYPDAPLLRMYAGERVDQPDACDGLEPAPGAPEWSALQYETLCRMRDVAHWWVTERQSDTGEFGGKLDDDVELLRWWVPLIVSGDTTALRGWKKLADGVWTGDWLEDGYSKRAIDVEHSSELIADTQPLLTVFSDDPAYVDRLRPSARHFEGLWTGQTPEGHRFFRSAWFSSTVVNEEPPRNRDVAYNTRATKAVRYLAWRTGDAAATAALDEWSRAWVSAAARTSKGKPAGLFPASVRFPDEAFNGDEPTWYRADMFWDYFDWSGGSQLLDQTFFSYTLSGDDALLAPLFAALELVARHPDDADAPEGSETWAAHILRGDPGLWRTAAQWRLYTGDTRYDALLEAEGTPYLRYRLTGDESHLREALQPILDHVRYNTPLLTTEALHTDRVYVTDDHEVGADELKAMLTGDSAGESASPYFAVTWEQTGDGFTALVADAGPRHLAVHTFNHGVQPDPAVMRLWQLAPGRYRLIVGSEPARNLVVTERGQRVALTLPARAGLDVRIAPAP